MIPTDSYLENIGLPVSKERGRHKEWETPNEHDEVPAIRSTDVYVECVLIIFSATMSSVFWGKILLVSKIDTKWFELSYFLQR